MVMVTIQPPTASAEPKARLVISFGLAPPKYGTEVPTRPQRTPSIPGGMVGPPNSSETTPHVTQRRKGSTNVLYDYHLVAVT